MSVISQDLLDSLNKKEEIKPTELEKFNKEYDAVLKEIEKKKKKDTSHIPYDPDDASYIPGPEPDSDDEFHDDGDEASHIPD